MTRIECDVLVIGSGAAGGVFAATLSELLDARVVLVERGGYFGREAFDQHEWSMASALYADGGKRTTDDGAIPVRGGECVGGGTTVNIALCFDPVRAVWEGWKRDLGLTGFSFDASAADYGVPGLNLASCVAELRERLHVAPASDEAINENNRLFGEGCERLGIGVKRFDLNMRGCIGCGFCAEGCAYDAKQGTMVTYIADALRRGVQLVHHCRIDRLRFEQRGAALVATGAEGEVEETRAGSRPNAVAAGPIQLSAKVVVVAAGAIETPTLLQRSSHPDPHGRIGRGLVLHPSLPVIGVLEREISNYRGISGSLYSDHFYRSHGFYLECLFGHPVYGSLVLPFIGQEHFELLRRLRSLIGFGVMLVDEVDDRNRVTWNAIEEQSQIRYRLSDADRERLRFAARAAVEVMFATGAKEVLLPSEEPIGPLPSPRFASPAEAVHCAALQFVPHQTVLTSAHCQATAKMGEDSRRSVVSSRCESHAVKNLLVCDSSSFPSSCGANPMLSIMALARYQAKRVAAERARYEL